MFCIRLTNKSAIYVSKYISCEKHNPWFNSLFCMLKVFLEYLYFLSFAAQYLSHSTQNSTRNSTIFIAWKLRVFLTRSSIILLECIDAEDHSLGSAKTCRKLSYCDGKMFYYDGKMSYYDRNVRDKLIQSDTNEKLARRQNGWWVLRRRLKDWYN